MNMNTPSTKCCETLVSAENENEPTEAENWSPTSIADDPAEAENWSPTSIADSMIYSQMDSYYCSYHPEHGNGNPRDRGGSLCTSAAKRAAAAVKNGIPSSITNDDGAPSSDDMDLASSVLKLTAAFADTSKDDEEAARAAIRRAVGLRSTPEDETAPLTVGSLMSRLCGAPLVDGCLEAIHKYKELAAADVAAPSETSAASSSSALGPLAGMTKSKSCPTLLDFKSETKTKTPHGKGAHPMRSKSFDSKMEKFRGRSLDANNISVEELPNNLLSIHLEPHGRPDVKSTMPSDERGGVFVASSDCTGKEQTPEAMEVKSPAKSFIEIRRPLGDITNSGTRTRPGGIGVPNEGSRKDTPLGGSGNVEEKGTDQWSEMEEPTLEDARSAFEEGYEVSIAKYQQLRERAANENATIVQGRWRAHKAQSIYKSAVRSLISLQSLIRRRPAVLKYRLLLGRRSNGAVAIQSAYRSHVHRKVYITKVASAIVIQSFFRMRAALTNKWELLRNTIKLQSVFRRHVAVLRFDELRFIANVASPVTVSVFRQHFDRLKLSALREFRAMYEKGRIERACAAVQNWWRRALFRRKNEEDRRTRIVLENEAATVIQTCFRRTSSAKRIRSAIRFQSCTRDHSAKQRLKKRSEQMKMVATTTEPTFSLDGMMEALEVGVCGGFMPFGNCSLFPP